MKFFCHVRLCVPHCPATLRDDSKYCKISHLWSPPVSVYSVVQCGVCTGCRVHHLNMITSYKLCVCVREGQNRSFSAGCTRPDYFQDHLLCRRGRNMATVKVVIHGVFLFSVVGWVEPRAVSLGSAGSPSPSNILSHFSHIRLDTGQLQCLPFLPPSLDM